MRCTKRRTDGEPCQRNAIAGTDACPKHVGTDLATAKAKGAVVVELSKWGLTDQTLDPGVTLLRLMTQAVYRAEHYARLLEEAYEAAERLAAADTATADRVPGQQSNASDLDRAQQDLDRVFSHGGVSALIGHTYSAAGKDGYVFATGEAIRGLVQLEAQERDRAATFAAKALAAGIAERQVRIAESQGLLIAQVMRESLTELARMLAAGEITTVDPSVPAVTRVVSARLRAVGT